MALEAVLSKAVADALVVLVLEAVPEVLNGGLGHGQAVDEVLVVDAHAEAGVAPELALGRVALSGEELKEGGLSCAVGADYAHPRVHVDTEVDPVEDDGVLLRVAEVDLVHLHDGPAELSDLRELELDGVVLGPLEELGDLSSGLPARNGLLLLLLRPSPRLAELTVLDLLVRLGPARALGLEGLELLLLLLPGHLHLLSLRGLHLLVRLVSALVGSDLEILEGEDLLNH
mmetsp:Transcript_19754/g.39501  ORF Transcript_19754/g.39501 Transcript_19754/m.39501 type:complete len:230 (+) Transcript_19754:487-1176(+)